MTTPPLKDVDTEASEGFDSGAIKEAARIAVDFVLSGGKGAEELEKYAAMKNGRDHIIRRQLELGVVLLLESESQNREEMPQLNFSERAQQIMENFLGNEDFFVIFCEYISGLRWSTDQQKCIEALFEHGTNFDASLLAENLTPDHLMYGLSLPIDYSERSKWDKKSVKNIFELHPELDYRRLLNDSAFAQSPEGIKLRAAYEKLCGSILYRRYERHESPRVRLIPLSKFPLVEAIVVDEVRDYGPTSKYSMGPSSWIEEIWQSDSIQAQCALVDRINTRLPLDRRNPFDGPTEFKNKGYVIESLRSIYDQNAIGLEAHERLRAHLLTILEAYTFDGPIAVSVRDEDEQRRADAPSYYFFSEGQNLKKIVGSILESLLVDFNAQAREAAEMIMNRYAMAQRLAMPLVSEDGAQKHEDVLVEQDVLTLDQSAQQIVLMNALNNVSQTTDLTVFERIGGLVFSPEAVVELCELAREKSRILPLIFPPRELDRKERETWWKVHSEEVDKLGTDYHHRLNMFLVQQIEGIVKKGEEMRSVFEDFVKKILLPYSDTVASEEYRRLVAVGKDSSLSPWNKTGILYRVTEQLEHRKINDGDELKQIMLDSLEIYLGPTTFTQEELVKHLKGMLSGNILDVAKRNANTMRAIGDPQFWSAIETYRLTVQAAIETSIQEDDQEVKIDLEHAQDLLHVLMELKSSQSPAT